KRAYCLKTQPATGETYPKSDLFNKAPATISLVLFLMLQLSNLCMSAKLILVMKLVVQEMTLAIIFPLRIRFIAN
ncbi:hypothetical protein, partial [Klebsiella pneumoniae]|uniref:hypothetical protein n=1 Tax=Klebsiella pneumoniae TaxID=573 RepID=UPI00215A2584